MASTRARPKQVHAALAFFTTLTLTLLVWLIFRPRMGVWQVLGAWLIGVNVAAFCYYGFDKAQARIGGARVPEMILHGLAIAGGSLGAYAGMRVFRHKTIKGDFRMLFWVIVVVQLAVAALVAWQVWKQ